MLKSFTDPHTEKHMSEWQKPLNVKKNIILIRFLSFYFLFVKRHITFHMEMYDEASKIVWLNYIFCATETFMILIFFFRPLVIFRHHLSSLFLSPWGFCGLCFRCLTKKTSRRWKCFAFFVLKMVCLFTGSKWAYKCFNGSKQFPPSTPLPCWFVIRRFLCWTFAICFFFHSSSSFSVVVWRIHIEVATWRFPRIFFNLKLNEGTFWFDAYISIVIEWLHVSTGGSKNNLNSLFAYIWFDFKANFFSK